MTSFAASNKTGTALAQYATLTGMSTRKVQEYNAAIQLATGNQREINTTLATFTDLQNKINDIRFNNGGIVGHLQLMFSSLGMQAPDPSELQKWAGNVDMLTQHMRRFAETATKRGMEPGMIRKVLEGITSDEDMIASMMNGGLTTKKLDATMPLTISDAYINKIKSGAEAWAKMHIEMENAMAKFNAIDGAKLANDLTPLIEAVLKLTLALVDLADKAKVFVLISHSIEGLAKILNGDLFVKLNSYGAASRAAYKILNDPNTAKWGAKMGGYEAQHTFLTNQILTNNSITTNVYTDTKEPKKLGDTVGHGVKGHLNNPALSGSN